MKRYYSFFLSLVAFGVGATSHADRLIQVPTGRKLAYRTIRPEFMFEPHKDGTSEYYLGLGLTNSIEMEFRTQRFRNQNVKQAIDLSYNLVGPIPDLSPGVSIGVQDAMNATSDSRRVFVAVTVRQTLDGIGGDVYGDLTIGGYFGTRGGAFVGLSLPISQQFRFVIDHNGYRAAGGIEIAPVKGASIKFIARAEQTFLSCSYSTKF
jgi:hypothetical protein